MTIYFLRSRLRSRVQPDFLDRVRRKGSGSIVRCAAARCASMGSRPARWRMRGEACRRWRLDEEISRRLREAPVVDGDETGWTGTGRERQRQRPSLGRPVPRRDAHRRSRAARKPPANCSGASARPNRRLTWSATVTPPIGNWRATTTARKVRRSVLRGGEQGAGRAPGERGATRPPGFPGASLRRSDRVRGQRGRSHGQQRRRKRSARRRPQALVRAAQRGRSAAGQHVHLRYAERHLALPLAVRLPPVPGMAARAVRPLGCRGAPTKSAFVPERPLSPKDRERWPRPLLRARLLRGRACPRLEGRPHPPGAVAGGLPTSRLAQRRTQGHERARRHAAHARPSCRRQGKRRPSAVVPGPATDQPPTSERLADIQPVVPCRNANEGRLWNEFVARYLGHSTLPAGATSSGPPKAKPSPSSVPQPGRSRRGTSAWNPKPAAATCR